MGIKNHATATKGKIKEEHESSDSLQTSFSEESSKKDN